MLSLELITYLLRAFGYDVLAASDGTEGLELVHREKIDLIICDISLPDIDGFEVARQLKNDPELCRIPLIAVTALAMVGDRERMLASGFDGYISKPIDPAAFVQQIEVFLNNKTDL